MRKYINAETIITALILIDKQTKTSDCDIKENEAFKHTHNVFFSFL